MKKHNKNNEVKHIAKNYITDDDQYKDIKWTVHSLIELCDKFHFEYNITGDCMFVKTAIGNWYFYINQQGTMRLFHENLLSRSVNNKFSNCYHVQKKTFCNPVSIINYIYAHDRRGYEYMRYSRREKDEYAAKHTKIYS